MTDSTAACTACPCPRDHRQEGASPRILGLLARAFLAVRPRARPVAPAPAQCLTTLGTLQIGERGRVQGFAEGGRAYRRKLLSMGLTPGVQFQVLRVAPLGDPVEVRVRGSNLSLRKAEAATLRVERLGLEHPS